MDFNFFNDVKFLPPGISRSCKDSDDDGLLSVLVDDFPVVESLSIKIIDSVKFVVFKISLFVDFVFLPDFFSDFSTTSVTTAGAAAAF